MALSNDAAFVVVLREQVQRADAEVEAVEHRVAGEQHADEDEPDGVQIEIHGEIKFESFGFATRVYRFVHSCH